MGRRRVPLMNPRGLLLGSACLTIRRPIRIKTSASSAQQLGFEERRSFNSPAKANRSSTPLTKIFQKSQTNATFKNFEVASNRVSKLVGEVIHQAHGFSFASKEINLLASGQHIYNHNHLYLDDQSPKKPIFAIAISEILVNCDSDFD